MIKVIVPYAGDLQPLIPQLLRSYGICPTYVKLDHTYAYHALMARLWEEGQTFVIVEHDILPWPGAIEEVLACPCEWGTYSYRCHGGIGIAHMLGCAKITTKLMERLPAVWDTAGVHWSQLDGYLFHAARDAGQEPHLHRPPVIHLNPREMSFTLPK